MMNQTITSESRLSYKIRICEYLESIKEDEVLSVLQLIKQELNCTSINQLLIKIVIDSNELFTNDALMNIASKTNLLKNTTKTNNRAKAIKIKNVENNHEFPILRLPKDIITSTSLYLNENDLLQFERCNRMLYKMINNSSYLKKCRNFKTFRFTSEILDQIAWQRIDCYKFAFAESLRFSWGYDIDDVNEPEFERYNELLDISLKERRMILKRVMYYGSDSYKYQSNWFDKLFESITEIHLNDDGMLLIDILPIEILFDKNRSQLKNVTVSDYWEDRIPANVFQRIYSGYFDTELHAHECKILENVWMIGSGFDINATKVSIFTMLTMSHLKITLSDLNCMCFKTNQSLTSHLTKLSLYNCKLFLSDKQRSLISKQTNKNHENNKNNKNNNCNVKIDTLRLITMREASQNLVDESLIEFMNLQSNLKNLTMAIWSTTSESGTDYISSVIRKEHLFNLENVNILLSPSTTLEDSKIEAFIDDLFDILCDNVQLLKHQFKQLNFGIQKYKHVEGEQGYTKRSVCACFTWNWTINVKYINQQREKWKSLRFVDDTDNISDSSVSDCQNMYEQFLQQWT